MTPPSISMGEMQSSFPFLGRKLADLLERVGNELLPAKPRVHAHHQNKISNIQDFVQSGDRCTRIDDHPRNGALGANHVESPIQMRASFLMNRDLIGSRLNEVRGVMVRVGDHQMNVQLHLGHLAERFHNGRPQSDIRDKMPVHHIHVEHLATNGFQLRHLLAQPGEIGSQN